MGMQAQRMTWKERLTCHVVKKKKKEGQSAGIGDYLWEVIYVGLGWEYNLMEGY